MTAANVLVALIFVTAVGWKLHQVSRAPHDRPLRAVTLCLVSAAVGYPIGLPKGQTVIDGVLGVGAAKLAQNILLLGTVYWLMCFYLYSAAEPRRGRQRARWESLPLLATAVVITVATVLTPPGIRDRTYATADMRVPELAVFYLTAGLYLVYALAMALRWTWPVRPQLAASALGRFAARRASDGGHGSGRFGSRGVRGGPLARRHGAAGVAGHGLVHISPYLAEAGAPGGSAPAQLAAQLRAALRRHRAGEPSPARAVPVAVPAEDGIDAGAEQLVALSEALRQD